MNERIAKIGKWMREWLVQPDATATLARSVLTARKTERTRKILRRAEIFLWVTAIAAIGYCSVAYAGAAMHQHREKAALSAATQTTDSPEPTAAASSAQKVAVQEPRDYGVLGVVEIPRLNISSVVEEGVDSSTLWEAVGHIPGTAMPGQNGNSALAAHRDTYFSGLGDVVVGDEIVFRSATESFRYRVESTKIVNADATDALEDSPGPTLSLITCYPFHYVGPAPKRFIVTARAEVPSPSQAGQ
jgi:sortase A